VKYVSKYITKFQIVNMKNLLESIAEFLQCDISQLQDRLYHPSTEMKVADFLKDKKITTTYYSRSGEQKDVKFDGFCLKSSEDQKAYEGFLGVTVQQHFYCRHRIRLEWPRIRCVVENSNHRHNKYFPPELLTIVVEKEKPFTLFSETSNFFHNPYGTMEFTTY
jgi:hypothetical protein